MSWSVNTKSLLGLYYFSSKDSKTLEVVSDISDAGKLKMFNYSSCSQIALNLELNIGDLNDLRKYNRESLFNFFPKFYKPNKNKYKEEYDIIFDELEKYDKIRFIFSEKDTNSVLSIYYMLYEFYDIIKNIEITITEFDIYTMDYTKERAKYEEACLNEKILTTEDIERYRKIWEQEIKKNSEIRNIEKGEIVDYSIKDISKKILEFMIKEKPEDTFNLIQKLIKSDVLNIQRGLYTYNYIMEYMISEGMIKTDNSGELALNDQIRMEKIIY